MFERLSGERDGSRAILALRRMWWVIMVVAVISAGGAYLLGKRQPTEYSATASLLFRDSQLDQWLFGVQAFNNASTDPNREPATNQALVELPTVATRVAQQLHIPQSRVLSAMSFGSLAQSDVLTITATDHDAKVAAAIANRYAQQYIVFRQLADRSQLSEAEQLIKNELGAIPPSERNSPTAKSLQARSNVLRLLASLQTGNAEVVQTATPPTSPSAPHPTHDGMIGLILGLLVGGAIAIGVARRDRRIRSREQVEEFYRVPVIGAIPESNGLRGAPGLGTSLDREAFRMIRARLRYYEVARDVKRVVITSADYGEGKSVVALSLARAAGEVEGYRVVLLEANLRRPSLAKKMDLETPAGLAELLTDFEDLSAGLRELVVTCKSRAVPDSSAGFDVLAAGAMPPNPGELLESKRMAEVMELLKSEYDMVIIDTAAIGTISDAIPLVHRADGVLVVSRLGQSRRDNAIRVMKQLDGLNAHVLGVVINASGPSGADANLNQPRSASKSRIGSTSSRRRREPQRHQGRRLRSSGDVGAESSMGLPAARPAQTSDQPTPAWIEGQPAGVSPDKHDDDVNGDDRAQDFSTFETLGPDPPFGGL